MSALPKDERINISISTETLSNAMNNAAMSSLHAFRTEMAVGIVVYTLENSTGTDAKRKLIGLYQASGWSCTNPQDEAYKTVRRRAGASAALYEYLVKEDKLEDWLQHGAEGMILDSIMDKLKESDLKTVNGVLEFAGKPVALRSVQPAPVTEIIDAPKGPAQAAPKDDAAKASHPTEHHPKENPAENAGDSADDSRYEEWLSMRGQTPILNRNMQRAGYRHLDLKHVQAIIEPEATKDQIVAMALRLLAIAEAMNGAKTVQELPQEVTEQHEETEEDTAGNRAAAALVKAADVNGNVAPPAPIKRRPGRPTQTSRKEHA